MRRRDFILVLGGSLISPLRTHAQAPKIPRVGILLVENREPFWTYFRDGLRARGYVPGQNILLELRTAEGQLDRLPQLLVHGDVHLGKAGGRDVISQAVNLDELRVILSTARGTTAYFTFSSQMRPVLQKLVFKRQALHAAVLGFVHPVTFAEMRFSSDLPPDMRELIDETGHSNR